MKFRHRDYQRIPTMDAMLRGKGFTVAVPPYLGGRYRKEQVWHFADALHG